MRHWYVLLIVLYLPLQWAWAGAAACRADAPPTGYAQARAAMHLSAAADSARRAGGMDAASPHGRIAAARAPLSSELASAGLPGWEFEPDEEFDIVEQISEPHWRGVEVDSLACRAPPTEGAAAVAPPDPHEFDLPLSVAVVLPDPRDAPLAAAPQPPAAAPVFRFYRPPSGAA